MSAAIVTQRTAGSASTSLRRFSEQTDTASYFG
jgi:hypothetical protein